MKNVILLSFLLVFIGCTQNVNDNPEPDLIEFGVISSKELDAGLSDQLYGIMGYASRLDSDIEALLYTVKNPDESIVETVGVTNLKDGKTSFYPVKDDVILDIEWTSVVELEGNISTVYYSVDNTLIYEVSIDTETGIIVGYNVNENAFNSSGRLAGCGFLCRGGECVKSIASWFMSDELGVVGAIACGALIEACAAGVGIGCAIVAL